MELTLDFCGDGTLELDVDLGVNFGTGFGSSSRVLRNFCDDLRGGGLGGGGGSRLEGFLSLMFLSPSLTVEFDEDEVRDSLTVAKPWGSIKSVSLGVLPARLLVTGGLVIAGLSWRPFGMTSRVGADRPGDCEDMDVGVVSRL